MSLGEVLEAARYTACFLHVGYSAIRSKALEDAEADMSVVWHKPLD